VDDDGEWREAVGLGHDHHTSDSGRGRGVRVPESKSEAE
jgi:hypothetical protein